MIIGLFVYIGYFLYGIFLFTFSTEFYNTVDEIWNEIRDKLLKKVGIKGKFMPAKGLGGGFKEWGESRLEEECLDDNFSKEKNGLKKCPFCDEDIQNNAIKCKYCKERL